MGLFDFGKRPKSALNKDRKYFNSSEQHERKYAKSFNRRKKKYSRYDNGGEIPDEYLNKADVLIENDDSIIYDIAGEYGQIVDNVKHMRWFREEVAQRVMEGDGVKYAKGGGVSYNPYGKTKGRFTLTYNVDGEKQTEIWDSLEEAKDNARRYSSAKLGYRNVRVFDDSGKEYLFSSGGGVELNTEVILTENRPNGIKWKGVVKPFMLKSIQENQYSGGFKRYEIDFYDEVSREPSKQEIKQVNDFFDKVGGRYSNGGAVLEGTILYANTGVPVRVLKYNPKFGGRVLIERADGLEGGKPLWRPLKKFSKEKPKGFKKGGGISYNPYGKTKGRFTLTYNVGGEEQTEIWDSLEEATDNARRYSSVKLGYSDVRVFDDSGKEYLFSSGGGVGDKEKKQWVKSYLENTDEDNLRFILADIWGDSDYLDVMSKEKMISDIMKNDNNEIEYIYINYKGYSKGGGVELRDNFDYGGSVMTDENVVRENLSNGEIHCDILTEIIGCKPEYPHQIVGSIKLEKCFLRPYYRIA